MSKKIKLLPDHLTRLTLLILLTLFCPGTSSLFGQSTAKPNIIIIFTDDLGYGDLGVYGHPTIATPHLDRMASEGLKFSQFYVGASVCTPSRAALLTGRLPVRTGMASSKIRVLFPFSLSGLPDEEITVAEALKSEGYHTGMVGKWHLGHLKPFLPLQHGFDEYFGVPYSNDMRPRPDSKSATARNYPALPLIDGNEVIESGLDQRTLTKRYTERALSFIEGNKDESFFLYFAHSFPHIPLYASSDFEGKSARGLYGDVVEELDWSVGQVLEKVKDLGIEENTLVFFTSDNGPWLVMKEEGGSAGLLREGKGCTWEGGMREPAIAWWPGTIEAGGVTEQLATTMDLAATALDLAGYDRSALTLDGTSMIPIFEENSSIRDEVFYYWGTELYAVRKGAWKIHYKTITPYVGEEAVAHDPPLLYNLEIDPSEKYDKSSEHPEIIKMVDEVAKQHLGSFEPPISQLEKVDQGLRDGTKAYSKE